KNVRFEIISWSAQYRTKRLRRFVADGRKAFAQLENDLLPLTPRQMGCHDEGMNPYRIKVDYKKLENWQRVSVPRWLFDFNKWLSQSKTNY
ncbi:unnamed protein product, partial [Ceratitis capitata]